MPLYSIGHSNASVESFIALLRRHDIERIVDTRSQPFSRYTPHFNQGALDRALAAEKIAYTYMGDSLGGRPRDPGFYFGDGKVDYEMLAEAPFFIAGLKELIDLGRSQRVAFMCTEADFHKCHRYRLITRALVRQNVDVSHILHTGELACSGADEFQLEQPSLF